jgi:hypothetical protein
VNQNKIFDILTWLDAFFIYTSIYLVAHPDQAQKMLKYMANVKTAASRSHGFGWREYDRQFRIKKARNDYPLDPNRSRIVAFVYQFNGKCI